MYSLTFYKKTILFHDIINKYQYNNIVNIKKLNNKLKRVVIATKLTNDNEKNFCFILLVLEIYTFKKSFFNPVFTLTVRNGKFLWIKSELRKKHINFFLLKYLWIFAPALKKNKTKIGLTAYQVNNKNLFFKLNAIKSLGECFNLKLNNSIYFNFLIYSCESKFLRKFYKFNFIC